MQRFYVPPAIYREEKIIFSEEQFKHIKKVLRLMQGAEIEVTNGLGEAALCRLYFDKRNAFAHKIRPLAGSNEPALRVFLFQSLCKGEKMDYIVQKAVELGVYSIIPFISRRSVVRPAASGLSGRVARWRKIAVAALEQSGRSYLPEITEPVSFQEAIKRSGDGKEMGLSLIPWEEEKVLSLKAVLDEAKDPACVRLFIGPEGGFAPEEAAKAQRENVRPVTLGPRVLRTETAAVAALSVIMYHYGCLE
ncbi:MAG TPA: 16S rRNA (uracil(1498)-N(3))-methyltransferase [Firmicutes bacterium]|nr:16S rRNA (uracil(1498)-N(3))-methyltransferase [Bacillota bacterium]